VGVKVVSGMVMLTGMSSTTINERDALFDLPVHARPQCCARLLVPVLYGTDGQFESGAGLLRVCGKFGDAVVEQLSDRLKSSDPKDAAVSLQGTAIPISDSAAAEDFQVDTNNWEVVGSSHPWSSALSQTPSPHEAVRVMKYQLGDGAHMCVFTGTLKLKSTSPSEDIVVGSVPAECAPEHKYYVLANVHNEAGEQIWPTSTIQHQLFVEGTKLKLASSSSGGSVLLSLDGLTVSKVTPSDTQTETQDYIAKVQPTGNGIKGRLCHFGHKAVRFLWDDNGSGSYFAFLGDTRDAHGVSMCAPLTSTIVLGAKLGSNGKLEKSLTIQIEPHGALRMWMPKAGDSMEVSLAGVWYAPHAVSSHERAMSFSCRPTCFPGIADAETQPRHACIKLCAPARTTGDDGCSCVMLKRIQCEPTESGTQCAQYKELIAQVPAHGCSAQCARQLAAF